MLVVVKLALSIFLVAVVTSALVWLKVGRSQWQSSTRVEKAADVVLALAIVGGCVLVPLAVLWGLISA